MIITQICRLGMDRQGDGWGLRGGEVPQNVIHKGAEHSQEDLVGWHTTPTCSEKKQVRLIITQRLQRCEKVG